MIRPQRRPARRRPPLNCKRLILVIRCTRIREIWRSTAPRRQHRDQLEGQLSHPGASTGVLEPARRRVCVQYRQARSTRAQHFKQGPRSLSGGPAKIYARCSVAAKVSLSDKKDKSGPSMPLSRALIGCVRRPVRCAPAKPRGTRHNGLCYGGVRRPARYGRARECRQGCVAASYALKSVYKYVHCRLSRYTDRSGH